MIECLTDLNALEEQYASCEPGPVDSPTCNTHVTTCDTNLP